MNLCHLEKWGVSGYSISREVWLAEWISMGTELLSEKYAAVMDGTLNCFDRVVLTGSLQPLCYAQGMTSYLYRLGIRIFDYAQFSQPLHEQMVAHAEAVAKANGLEIEYIRKEGFSQGRPHPEDPQQRGEQPGLVHIFSALEPCPSYRPWHNKSTGRTYLLRDSGKCLHYYFYSSMRSSDFVFACANLVSFSSAVLLQRACLVGQPAEAERSRF